MSQENVEAFKRAVEASNRQDVEALLELLDPEIEWHSAFLMPFEGAAAVYRGHEGIRRLYRDLGEVLDEFHTEYSEIRDLGDRVVGIGHTRTRGKGSGAVTESPYATVIDLEGGKAVRIRAYLDPSEALKAAGLRE